jgi:lactoylglutathione lyase
MKIDHIAFWVNNLEIIKEFYIKYFNASSNEKYHNEAKRFQSYFLSFQDGCRIEIMNRPDITETSDIYKHPKTGITHFAFSAGSKDKVDELTEQLRKDGYTIAGEPRVTGDGCYESVILDPENNIVEITI